MNKIFSISALALLGATLLVNPLNAQTTTDAMNKDKTVAADTAATPMAVTPMAVTPMAVTGMMEKSMMTDETDRQFLLDVARGSVYDRATAELAVQKALNKDVQRYALRLMDDHNRLNKDLLMQANKRGLLVPLTIGSDDQSSLQLLMNVEAGRAFDVAYLQEAIRINTADVLNANAAIKASSDGKFRGLMMDYAQAEQKHLDMASRILSELQKSSPAMSSGMMQGMTK